MKSSRLDNTADKLLSLYLMFHVRILHLVHEQSAENPSSSHYRVLGMLMQQPALPTSEIGRRLCISKPNMTSLIDRLISEGMVTRLPDLEDRRIINITITAQGRSFMDDKMNNLKETIKTKLSYLSEEELAQMLNSLENLENVFIKLDLSAKAA